MKVVKGLLLFGFSAVVASCFSPPEFSVVPEIDLVNVYFREGTVNNPTDSLIITISFRDGDGDLGLSPTDVDPPYNDVFYGLANNGSVVEIDKKRIFDDLPAFVNVPPGTTGKLVTVRTLEDPAYLDDLPPFVNDMASCGNYRLQKLYIQDQDKSIIDASYPDIDTMTSDNGFPPIYVVEDMFYYKKNPNYANIDVEFWVANGDGTYSLFDWEKEYCESAFNQRFPILAEKTGALEGNLRYAMTSVGIKATFSIKTLKLRIRVRDRALNVSNEIQTEDFTLDKIKR